MKKSVLSLSLLAGALSLCMHVHAETVRLCSPSDYTVTGISDNGEWAVGLQANEISDVYAFRWNLITNEIDLSSVPSMCGNSISDDGTYCGGFNYTDESGKTTVLPGYYDGSWHLMPVPDGKVTDVIDGCISRDGRHMALSIELNGRYQAVQYKDKEFVRVLKSDDHPNVHTRVYDITDDGSRTCGWTYAIVNGKMLNRTGVYWEGDSNYKIIDRDPEQPENSPWAGAKRFSSDGNSVLYYGGWSVSDDTNPYVESIRNLSTGEIVPVYAVDNIGQAFELDDFSDDYTTVGMYNNIACISDGDKTFYLVDWLRDKKGIDARNDWKEVMTYEGDGQSESLFLLTRATCIQRNGKAIGILYNGTDYTMHSMVVRFDVTLDDCGPASVKATEISKANAVRIDWIMPYGMDTDRIKGYNVYRDGTKVNSTPVTGTSLYDSGLEHGKTYSYQVSTIYESGESEKSDAVEISIVGIAPEKPASLFARQKGLNSVALSWEAPNTNLVRKHYDDDNGVAEGFGTSELNTIAEAAIKFSAEEMALYNNSKITAVEFYPMSLQNGWKIRLYSENADGKLTKLVEQKIANKDIKVGESNRVTLTKPIAIPAGENLLASVTFTVVEESTKQNVIGMQFGKVTKGYSDLLRQETIPPESFQSLVDMGADAGIPMNISWKMGIVLTPEGTSTDIDKVDKYILTRDGEEIYSGSELADLDENLADGTYTYGVAAVYSDGRQSAETEISSKVKMRDDAAYAAQNLAATSDAENLSVTWTAPVDTDITDITWVHGNKSSTKITSANNNYNLQAAAIYPASMLRGLDGYNIVGAKFYPTCDATYTIIIDNGPFTDDLAYYEVDSFKLNEWNTIYFDEPLDLDVNKKYRLIVDCYDVEDKGSPLAVDDTKGVDGYSCLINVSPDPENEEWQEVSAQTGTSTNWMISMVVADPEEKELPVKGYDVTLDGKKLNSALITETSYTHPIAQLTVKDGKKYKVAVDTWYEPATVAVPGSPVEIIISGAGIDETFVADMTVGNDGAILRVTNAAEVALYDMSGLEVTKVSGERVRIDSLTAGIYVVKAHDAEGKELVTKINIRRK